MAYTVLEESAAYKTWNVGNDTLIVLDKRLKLMYKYSPDISKAFPNLPKTYKTISSYCLHTMIPQLVFKVAVMTEPGINKVVDEMVRVIMPKQKLTV